MSSQESRDILNTIHVSLAGTATELGCGTPLISARVTDVDFEPEPGPYVDVAVSMRIHLEDFRKMQDELHAKQPGTIFQEPNS